jgi:hypothetical protein
MSVKGRADIDIELGDIVALTRQDYKGCVFADA